MNHIILATLCFTILASCQKEPTACIESNVNGTIQVFNEVNFKSCSVDATWYDWEIEDSQNNTRVFQYFVTEEVNFSWNEAGTFDISLTAKSENMKKQTTDYTQVVVVDVCYDCSNGMNSSTLCYSSREDKAGFDAALENFESSGFICTLK